jgi:hypothetical protein
MNKLLSMLRKKNRNPYTSLKHPLGRRNYLLFEEIKEKFPSLTTREIVDVMIQDSLIEKGLYERYKATHE